MSHLSILSGGAAQGLVRSLEPAFKARTGLDIEGEFGAVGTMADKLRAGLPTDLVILTNALVTTLAGEKLIDRATIADVDIVETALAVRSGDPQVDAKDAAALREALLASDAIFVPDTKASTAGIHVANMLAKLGIADEVAGRLNLHPNGATAMKCLAISGARRPIGCTQATEIISTPGVMFSGSLPPGCELATMYTAGITMMAAHTAEAKVLVELLTAADQNETRQRAGFVGKTR